MLIRADPTAVSAPLRNGRLPLHEACYHGTSVEVIRMLLLAYTQGLATPAFDGRLPLHYACMAQCHQILDELIHVNPETLSMAAQATGMLPIHEACIAGMPVRSVSSLIQNYPAGRLPLHCVCDSEFAQLGTAQCLLQHFPESVLARNGDGRLPLHCICSASANKQMVNLLLELYPDAARIPDPTLSPGDVSSAASLALHSICASPLVTRDAVQALLDRFPAAVARLDRMGRTPLLVACENHRAERLHERELLEVIVLLVHAQVGRNGGLVS